MQSKKDTHKSMRSSAQLCEEHQVSLGTFTVQHLNTKHLAADAMTKMLTKDQHERHSKFLRGHIPIMHPTTQQWLDIFEGDFKLRLNEYYSLD